MATRSKLAVTDRARDRVTVQVPVPLHEPLHPVNRAPTAGVAVSTTVVLGSKAWLQVLPQLMPDGDEVTEPEPSPASETFSTKPCWPNVAVKARGPDRLSVQLMPVQPGSLHPARVEPAAAVAVSVTGTPVLNSALHVPGQLMPAGDETIDPPPEPASATLNSAPPPKLACTLRATLTTTVQGPVPGHSGIDHPLNTDPPVGVAVS